MRPFISLAWLVALVAMCVTPLNAAAGAQRAATPRPRISVERMPPVIAPPARPPRKDPFRRLFSGGQVIALQQSESIAKPTVRCGTTLIPGDATIDPKIRAERRTKDLSFTIRGVQPSECWPR